MSGRGLVVVAAMLGIVFGMAVCSAVLRWILAFAILRKEPPSARGPLAWLAALILHSGPWLLAIVVAIAWNVLSAPHKRAWDVFFVGMAVSPFLLALLTFVALRRARKGKPLADPRKMTSEEQAQWGMREALWVSLPVFAGTLWWGWEFFVRLPELVLVLAAGVYLFSYLMCRMMTVIQFPQPWRLPPPKKDRT